MTDDPIPEPVPDAPPEGEPEPGDPELADDDESTADDPIEESTGGPA